MARGGTGSSFSVGSLGASTGILVGISPRESDVSLATSREVSPSLDTRPPSLGTSSSIGSTVALGRTPTPLP
ncbi:UNVERIFIED_CONTAM: hypothetical protein Sradi_4123300 [Sesamum radiatum]|uniref:Uncharacterized protein n=1 Tax=Sesamum radiatum TaxID=300843 RepID=A0AAW2P2M3_SESRA